MPTITVKKIGATNTPVACDYTTLQAWADAAPTDLVAADVVWRGECYDQGKFTANVIIGVGHTTDATRFFILTCAAGHSFRDKAAVRTTALNYNSTTGAGVAIETAAVSVNIQATYTVLDGLQIKDTAYGSAVNCATQPTTVRDCILTSTGSANPIASDGHDTSTWINNLYIYNFTSGTARQLHGKSYNETMVNAAGAGTSVAFALEYNIGVIRNCAVFGFGSFTSGTPAAGSDYNATDGATAVTGTHNQVGLGFAAQFVNPAGDFRSVTSGGLKHGTPDPANSPTDIGGFARDATTPFIGAWEATPPAAASVITEQGLPSNHAGNITVHVVGTGTTFTSSTTWTASGVAGWSVASRTFVDATHYTVVLTGPGAATPPAGAVGTLTLTEGVTDPGSPSTPTTTIGTPTLSVSPTTGALSGSTPITLTGANVLWAADHPAYTFGTVAGTSIGSISNVSNTSATATMTTGPTAGGGVIVDPSTGATANFTVGGTLAITTPAPWQTYQRDGSNHASIPIAFSWAGGPTGSQAIEASLAGGAYATIATITAGAGTSGTASGSLSATVTPFTPGVQGTLTIRFASSTGIFATATDVGVGDIIVAGGQSNAVGDLDALQVYTNGSGLKATCYDGAAWKEGIDPLFGVHSISGSIWPLVATHHMNDQGVPCGIVSVAIGGRSLVNTDWYWTKYRFDLGTQAGGYPFMTSTIAAAAVGANGVRAFFWYQGENDSDLGTARPAYAAALTALANNLNADVVGTPKLMVVQVSSNSSNVFPAPIALAQTDAVAGGGNLLGTACQYDLHNGLHMTDNAQGAVLAGRVWALSKSEVWGGTSGAGHGPRVVACQYNSARTTITVGFDKVLRTGSTFDASLWGVTGSGSAATVSAVAYHPTDTRSVVLTLSGAAAVPILVSFAVVAATAGKACPTGPDFVLPAGAGTINLPAEPFSAMPAALAAAGGGGGGTTVVGPAAPPIRANSWSHIG